jgi:hypothetical protein
LHYSHVSPDDGTGVFEMQAQMVQPVAPRNDAHISFYARWKGYRPVMMVQSLDREMALGSEIVGPENIWRIQANTGSTAPPNGSIPHTTTGTFAAPTATTALGFRQSLASGATSGNQAQITTTDMRWVRGDNFLPWCGYYYHYRGSFPSSLAASRLWLGMFNQTAVTMGASDDPAGHRHAFRLLNGSGNFFMSIKAGGTQALLDTGLAFAINKVYDFYIFHRPNGGYPFGQIDNLTDGTTSGALIDIGGAASTPGTTDFMRAGIVLQTTAAAAKTFEFHRMGVEIAA